MIYVLSEQNDIRRRLRGINNIKGILQHYKLHIFSMKAVRNKYATHFSNKYLPTLASTALKGSSNK